MLRLKNGGSIRKGGEKTSTRDYAFRRADGTEMTVPVRTSACSRIEVSNVSKKVRSLAQIICCVLYCSATDTLALGCQNHIVELYGSPNRRLLCFELRIVGLKLMICVTQKF